MSTDTILQPTQEQMAAAVNDLKKVELPKQRAITLVDIVTMGRRQRRKIYRRWCKANNVPKNPILMMGVKDMLNFRRLNYLTFLEDVRKQSGEPLPIKPEGEGAAL